MKKNLLFLGMILVTLSLFNACSDDDKNQEWENLPAGPIQNDKVAIDLNGTPMSGTVILKATSNEAAQILFQNVIPGYSDVTVDVKMEKQPDNSFTFSGTKDIATAPTKADATPVFLTVTVNGTIGVDGKVTVNIATSGLGTYIGTYSGTTLKLMYGDSELTGKSVVFDATQPQDATIKLVDVIPGDTVTLLTGIQLNENGFSGSSTTTAAKVDYTGALKDKVLTLNLNVTMNDPQGWAKKYGLGEIVLTDPTKIKNNPLLASACYLEINGGTANMQYMIRGILGGILPQVLKNVSLQSDGNIVANYSSDTLDIPSFQTLMQWGNGQLNQTQINTIVKNQTWKESPKNLAYWFEKEGKLIVKLNISAIIIQSLKDNGSSNTIDFSNIITGILNSDVSSLKELLNGLSTKLDPQLASILANLDDKTLSKLLEWMKNGIALNVSIKDGHTYIYLDYNDLNLFVKLLPNLSPLLTGMLPPDMANQAPAITGMINQFIKGWETTTVFNLGLDLVN